MTSLKVLYDHQIFDLQRYGGISRYYTELIKDFRVDENISLKLGLRFSDNNYLSNLVFAPLFTQDHNIWLGTEKAMNAVGLKGLARSAQIKRAFRIASRNRQASVKALRKGDFDIFHPTYYDSHFIPHLQGRPFVLTVYDMIHERFIPDAMGNPIVARKRELAEKAERIIAISESTKRDVVDILGVPSNKVVVTHLAGSLPAPTVSGAVDGIPPRYLLFVGLRGGYKNFEFMLQALEPIFQGYQDVHLICAGGGPFNDPEQQMVKRSKGNGRIRQMSVSDEVLARLYSNALVFIYPSRYEGFGIPILEAMTCGCPTLISRSSSFPEVGGDAARYFELDDEEGFQEALSPLLEDADIRDAYRQKGYHQATKFSWQKTASMTKDVYVNILR